jgi:hypothetical protein
MKRPRIVIQDRGVRIAVDLEATARLYAAIDRPASERCKCVECRGFVANRGLLLPQSFLALLRRLYIDPTNESELWAVSGARDFYVSGQFDFIGKVARPSRTAPFRAQENFDYTFTNDAGNRCMTVAKNSRLGTVAGVRFAATLAIALHSPYAEAASR